jgi:hypothetical protein
MLVLIHSTYYTNGTGSKRQEVEPRALVWSISKHQIHYVAEACSLFFASICRLMWLNGSRSGRHNITHGLTHHRDDVLCSKELSQTPGS